VEPSTEPLPLILADINGYTRFMLASQLASVHGQQVLTQLIEAILREVEIPLEVKEIEGDAVEPPDGIRILECAVFHTVPGGSAIFGDLGADVIKIETPAGDLERHRVNAGGIDFSLPNGDSAMFEASNRNKRGICLDMMQYAGREIFDLRG
jgi:hypothetical protein